jgi:hypothetical protein
MGDNPDFSSLVGQNANDVKDSLLRDYPDVVKIVEIMTPGMPITEDYCPTRLRLFVDRNGVIHKTPVLG